MIQQAWENGEEVFVHGLVFNVATGELRQVMGPYSGNENVPENSTELDADSLAADSAKLKKSRSLAGVMNKLGEALQVRTYVLVFLPLFLFVHAFVVHAFNSIDCSCKKCHRASGGGRGCVTCNGFKENWHLCFV